jgi:hypothetical protein
MTDQEKWIEALARLTRKTQEGEIKWKSIPVSNVRDPLGVALGIEKAFEATFKNQRIRAYRTDKAWVSWNLRSLSRAEFVIEFLNENGLPIYRPPMLDGTKDLISAIEYQAAPANHLIENQTAPARDLIDALLRD